MKKGNGIGCCITEMLNNEHHEHLELLEHLISKKQHAQGAQHIQNPICSDTNLRIKLLIS